MKDKNTKELFLFLKTVDKIDEKIQPFLSVFISSFMEDVGFFEGRIRINKEMLHENIVSFKAILSIYNPDFLIDIKTIKKLVELMENLEKTIT